MKALTLHQPHAQLVVMGVKTIETRSWPTKYRGRLLIHASAKRPLLFHHHDINSDPPLWVGIPGGYDWGERCEQCKSKGTCDSIPAKGKKRIWEWTP